MKNSFILIFFLAACGAHSWQYEYEVTTADTSVVGRVVLTLSKRRGTGISPLTLVAETLSPTTLRIAVRDPSHTRWEVPAAIAHAPQNDLSHFSSSESLRFSWTKSPFTFAIQRQDTTTLFNTSTSDGLAPLVFEDQFIGVSAEFASDSALFGIGERQGPLRVAPKQTMTLWNADPWSDTGVFPGINLYGDYPFAISLSPESGTAFGMLFANSNAKQFATTAAGTLEMHAAGGIVDLWFFAGPSPALVVEQLSAVIGRPSLPPYWALGYHQSGLGMSNADSLESVLAQFVKHDLQCDCIWSDIDHMDGNRDFTFAPNTFNSSFARDYTARLLSHNIRWVPILDHCIAIDAKHEPYTLGMEMGIFARDPDTPSAVLQSKLWPGVCAMVDFSHPNATEYWTRLLRNFYQQGAQFSGIWVDMNEPSNICDGYCDGRIPKGNLNNPPWSPLVRSGWKLFSHSLPMDSRAAAGLQYDVHNLYGYFEAAATNNALRTLFGTSEQPFVLTRGNSFGSAQVAAHWLGDNSATWEQLRWSMSGVLSYQLFAAPFVGPDICGFIGKSSEELCTRWLEIGAFYPFSRNHASDVNSNPHYPWTYGDKTITIFKKVFGMRYRLLPYLNTLFVAANETGSPVWRPLWMDFALDKQTLDIDRQAMFGTALLLSPVLDEGATTVTAYLPTSCKWYDLWSLKPLTDNGWMTLQAPLETIPVHIRGGSVIPMQDAERTATASRKTPFRLIVAPDSIGQATGSLAFDSLRVSFALADSELIAKQTSGIAPSGMPLLTVIDILGISMSPKAVFVNGVQWNSWHWNAIDQTLSIIQLELPVSGPFSVLFK